MPEPNSPFEISVIIPTYNRARLIGRAIRSALSQTSPVLEVIIVDDGSEDDTSAVVDEFVNSDLRVKYLKTANRGAPQARNCGILKAHGTHIAFLDSDDEWKPNFIESLLPKLHHYQKRVVFSSHEVVYVDGFRSIVPDFSVVNPYMQILKRNFISTQTAIVNRSLFDAAMFDPRLPRMQDWDLWLQLRRRAEFVHVPLPLATLYRQDDSLSENTGAYYAALRMVVSKHFFQFASRPTMLARFLVRCMLRRPFRRSSLAGHY